MLGSHLTSLEISKKQGERGIKMSSSVSWTHGFREGLLLPPPSPGGGLLTPPPQVPSLSGPEHTWTRVLAHRHRGLVPLLPPLPKGQASREGSRKPVNHWWWGAPCLRAVGSVPTPGCTASAQEARVAVEGAEHPPPELPKNVTKRCLFI